MPDSASTLVPVPMATERLALARAAFSWYLLLSKNLLLALPWLYVGVSAEPMAMAFSPALVAE